MKLVTYGNAMGQVLQHILYAGRMRTLMQTVFADGRTLALLVLDRDGGVYEKVSVCPQDVVLEDDEVWVKAWSLELLQMEALWSTGLFEDTGKVLESGFVEGPVWRLVGPAWRP